MATLSYIVHDIHGYNIQLYRETVELINESISEKMVNIKSPPAFLIIAEWS